MVVTIKKGATLEEMKEIEKKIFSTEKVKKGFDAKKYNVTVKFEEDAMTIQKKLRNEWERNIC